ncbi:hypothetical protein AAVH_10789 [Aphelenchoides avenae]|nr:hypothetical protein AAVH_10789 [Aphelenchus avenae]
METLRAQIEGPTEELTKADKQEAQLKIAELERQLEEAKYKLRQSESSTGQVGTAAGSSDEEAGWRGSRYGKMKSLK